MGINARCFHCVGENMSKDLAFKKIGELFKHIRKLNFPACNKKQMDFLEGIYNEVEAIQKSWAQAVVEDLLKTYTCDCEFNKKTKSKGIFKKNLNLIPEENPFPQLYCKKHGYQGNLQIAGILRFLIDRFELGRS